MVDPVRELKARAEILHGRVEKTEEAALRRLRALPELRRASDEELRERAARVQRKPCLAVVALEHGFASWDHAARVLRGEADDGDWGKLLNTVGCANCLSCWFTTYEEAREQREARGGYLLPYARHFVVTDWAYVENLGVERDDPDWEAIGWDWVRPRDPAARARLYGKVIAARRVG